MIRSYYFQLLLHFARVVDMQNVYWSHMSVPRRIPTIGGMVGSAP